MSPPMARRVLHLLRHQSAPNIKKGDSNEYNLTEREKEIFTSIVHGGRYKTVGSKLNIGTETVRHQEHLFKT